MKKLLFIALILCTGMAFGQITGSAHDFSGADWNTSGEICITCHTPHNASITENLLWNHGVTAATFTLYTNSDGTLDGTTTQPAGSSKLCLSCHDGTVALDNFGGGAGDLAANAISTGDLGTNISDDHPVSITYVPGTETGQDAELVAAPVLLIDGKVECASCHDVHDDTHGNFLVMANTASALCLECHIK